MKNTIKTYEDGILIETREVDVPDELPKRDLLAEIDDLKARLKIVEDKDKPS